MKRALLALLLAAGACRREPPPPPPPVAGPVVVPVAHAPALVLSEVTGAVTREGQAVAQGEPLRAGDVLELGGDGAATLRLVDGRSLALAPSSRVRIKAAQGGAGALAIEIEEGAVVSRVPAGIAGAITLDILTPLGIVRVPAHESESTITVRPDAVSVAVAVGEIDFLGQDGKSTRAGATQRLEVSLGGIVLLSTAPPPAPAERPPGELAVKASPRARRGPEIALPPARGVRVYADALAQINLTWPTELADAVVEVASDPKFEKVTLKAPGAGGSLRLPAPKRGQLYWRISGTSGGARRTLLGHARFLPDRARSLLDLSHPRNLVADTGQVTTVYFQSVLPALTFTYAAKPGASGYRIQVFRAADLAKPVHDQRVKSTTCALAAGVLGEGSYLWHAVALDAGGQELGGGLMNKLEIVYDNPLNTLAIGSPKPGQAVTGPKVEVTGAAPVGSRLYVNGRPVPLDAKGRFEVRVERSPALVFRLVGGDGSESYWVRQLRTRS